MNGLRVEFEARVDADVDPPPASRIMCISFTATVADRSPSVFSPGPEQVHVATSGRTAGALAGRLRRGARIRVAGRLRLCARQADDGQQHPILAVAADSVELVDQATEEPVPAPPVPEAPPLCDTVPLVAIVPLERRN